jgi:hypothetical protein
MNDKANMMEISSESGMFLNAINGSGGTDIQL